MVNYLALISAIRTKKRSPKAMRRGRRRRGGERLEIPLDVQEEILTRLPAKSLMKFKCVSKLWSGLIRSRYLTNRYISVASRPPRLYMSSVEQLGCASMEVFHNPGKSQLVSFSSSSSDSGESFSADSTMPGMGGSNMVALRGLLLYNVCRRACIYNPATRQTVTLPAVNSSILAQGDSRKYVFYFLGHHPVLDQYKVVCNVVLRSSPRITSEHWVFVLEAGGSWKKIESDQTHVPTSIGVCVNGVMYYLASTSSTSRGIVFSFDVRSEELNTIQVPPSVSGASNRTGFIEYGGKPAVFDHTHLGTTGLVEWWVLEDGRRWSRKSLALHPCQMHMVDGTNHLAVQCTAQTGEVILAPNPMPPSGYFLYYDLQKNALRKVHVNGLWDGGFGEKRKYFAIMGKSESIMHLET